MGVEGDIPESPQFYHYVRHKQDLRKSYIDVARGVWEWKGISQSPPTPQTSVT